MSFDERWLVPVEMGSAPQPPFSPSFLLTPPTSLFLDGGEERYSIMLKKRII